MIYSIYSEIYNEIEVPCIVLTEHIIIIASLKNG